MRRAILILSAVALMTAGASTTVFADAVADCAKIQGTALTGLFGTIFKEAAKACGKGSALVPLAVSQAATGSATGKFYGKIGKGVDKLGSAACLINLTNVADPGLGVDPKTIYQTIVSLAGQACLVP